MDKRADRGVTLIELIVVIAIIAIVLMQGDFAGMFRSWESRKADIIMRDIAAAITLARQTAISESQVVTFCRSNDGLHCQGKWHDGSIIFTDNNADRQINESDRLLYRLEPVAGSGILTFNSFRNRQYLQLTPRGMTNYQNGNFTFCPASKDPRLIRQLIVSISGRSRPARDMDGDGIVENSQGEPVACD